MHPGTSGFPTGAVYPYSSLAPGGNIIVSAATAPTPSTVRFRASHEPARQLWLPWTARLVEPLAYLYALSLFAVWLIEGSNTVSALHLGWWFSWQVLILVIILPPYVIAYRGTFDGIDDSNAKYTIAEQASAWIHIRILVQFLVVLTAAVVNLVFFVLRIIDFISDCGTGSLCDSQTTSFALVTALSFIQVSIALVLAFFIAKCPVLSRAIAIPAPPQAPKRETRLGL